ncbi:MAG TPA: NrfD/PsrC family molybdoenzyme membrane anchor subunit [Planctomycetota bacterium]|nr:NrfD/PsrC family molybdoenzyme membrane anchor subunit [Planctomycetota bacterium]
MPEHFVAPPEWGWYIVWYFYCGGIAGGAYLLGTLLRLRGVARDAPVSRLAFMLSFAAMAVCPVLLTLDLGQPSRFWHMLIDTNDGGLAFKYWSPMSVGAWVLLIFGAFCTATFAAAVAQARGWEPKGRLGALLRLASHRRFLIAGSVFGLFLAGYTGVLLSVSNQPLWSDTWALGGLLLASGLSIAAAALVLLAKWNRADAATTGVLHDIDGSFIGLELLLLVVCFASLGSLGFEYARWPWLLLWLLVLAAIVGPIVLRRRAAGGGVIPAAAMVLVGGLALRIVVVFAPQAHA